MTKPTMERRHFELIASWLRTASMPDGYDTGCGEYTRADLAQSLACVLAQTNPSFNRARFLEACGVQS